MSLLLSAALFIMLATTVNSLQKPLGRKPKGCPAGQQRRAVDQHSGQREYYCCQPWNYTCPLNYYYDFCGEDGAWDRCVKCPDGYVLPFPSSAASPIQCYRDTKLCSEDKIALNTTAMRCMCDLANNYFPLPMADICGFKPCNKGEHLVRNGSCVTCPLGSYKNWTGAGQCLPWTNCVELGLFQFRRGSHIEDSTCGLKSEPSLPTSTNISRPALHRNSSGTDIKVQRGENRVGIIGAFIVVGGILMGMLVLAFILRKRACPPKTRNDQLYLEMNLRGVTGRHQYEQVQTSDDDLENSPSSPRIFQISSRSSRGGNRFRYPPQGEISKGYGNLVISTDQETLADELAGLTVNLPDSPQHRGDRPMGVVSPQPREEDGEEALRTSGGSIPFDSFLRLTPLDSEGRQFVDQGLPPLDYSEADHNRSGDYREQVYHENRQGYGKSVSGAR